MAKNNFYTPLPLFLHRIESRFYIFFRTDYSTGQENCVEIAFCIFLYLVIVEVFMCFGPGKYFMTVFSVFVLHFFIKSVNKNVQLISQHFFIIPTCVCIIDHWNNFVGLRQKLHTLHAFLRGKNIQMEL